MSNYKNVKLEKVGDSDRVQYLDYLLLADESIEVVNKYINDGEMYAIHFGSERVGVMLFTFHPHYVVELKNIALDLAFRGKGVGKAVITEAIALYNEKGYEKMIVGTANSSIGNLAFYQKIGFRMIEIKKGFFENYPEPIYEDGIRAMDMVMLEKGIMDKEK